MWDSSSGLGYKIFDLVTGVQIPYPILMDEREELFNLVSECNSYSEILRRQGKAISGSSVKHLKEKLLLYGIDFISTHKNIDNFNKRPVEMYLKENISTSSRYLKQRLIKEGLKKDICEICGQSNEWNGKPLTLQLDHINGDHYDNRLENLRVVCPNCHTQTETFGTRKSTKKCPDCGAEISRKSTYCRKCASRHREEEKRLKQTKG